VNEAPPTVGVDVQPACPCARSGERKALSGRFIGVGGRAGRSLRYLSLEITTHCNARCVICPNKDLPRRNRHMDADLALAIVDQAVALGVRQVHPHLVGEPTLHPEYGRIVAGIKARHPEVRIKTYTNASRLLDEGVRAAIARHVDELVVSIDGATEPTMRTTRPGLEPKDVVEGLARLRALRPRPHVTIRGTAMVENAHELGSFEAAWRPYADDVVVMGLTDYFGYLPVDRPRRGSWACRRVFEGVTVTVDGDVIPCCQDVFATVRYGNVGTRSLAEILAGAPATGFRRPHEEDRADEIPLCAGCTYDGR